MQTTSTRKTALLVGASSGPGFAMAEGYLKRGWQVIAIRRASSTDKLHRLALAFDGALEVETVDITIPGHIADLRSRLAVRKLDLLFVNAGVMNDVGETIADVSTDEFVRQGEGVSVASID